MAEKIRRVALSIQENEELSIAIRKYPCLYDKSKKEYKDKIVTANAWKEVADELDFINDGELTVFFEFSQMNCTFHGSLGIIIHFVYKNHEIFVQPQLFYFFTNVSSSRGDKYFWEIPGHQGGWV